MNHLNERGYALFLTISVISLITVLALGLITLTANSQKTTVGERYDQSLFYIAESGINLEKAKVVQVLNDAHRDAIKVLNKPRTEKEFLDFITPYGDVKGFYITYIEGNFCSIYSNIVDVNNCAKNKDITITNHYNHYNTQFNKQPITTTETSGKCIEDSGNVSCLFTILSTAKYDSEPTNNRSLEQTLKLDFNTTPTGKNLPLPVDSISDVKLEGLAALITGEIIVKGGGKGNGKGKGNSKNPCTGSNCVNGNIANPKAGHGFNYINGAKDITLKEEIDLNAYIPIKPSISESPTILNNINANSPLSGDIKLTKLDKGTTINTGDKNNIVNLYVDEIELDGIIISGEGKINIIVTKGVKSNLNGNFNQSGNPHQATIFYEGNYPSKINSTINGSFYTNSLPQFNGNESLSVKGNMYFTGTTISASGNYKLSANYLVAPNAHINLSGGGGNNINNFTGTILAKSLTIGGNINLVAGSNTIPLQKSSSLKYGNKMEFVKESSLKEI